MTTTTTRARVRLIPSVIDKLLLEHPARAPQTTGRRGTFGQAKVLGLIGDRTAYPEGFDSFHSGAMAGAPLLLAWLSSFPGATWQERWVASGTENHGREWTVPILRWNKRHGSPCDRPALLTYAVVHLAAAGIIRPSLRFLLHLQRSPGWRNWTLLYRDPEGFDRLGNLDGGEIINSKQGHSAVWQITTLLLAKGGRISDITVGDCIELRQAEIEDCSGGTSRYLFYKMLLDLGAFPADAPPTLRFITTYQGQRSIPDMVQAFNLSSPDIRDLLIDYLLERSPGLDYSTLDGLARDLAKRFWKTLEEIEPGINSLHLSKSTAEIWKEQIRSKTSRRRLPDGSYSVTRTPRIGYTDTLTSVRAFYLNLAAWAVNEPERWARWVAPCPVRTAETSAKKQCQHRKSRMDQRTRDRLPVVATLVGIAQERARDVKVLVAAATEAIPGTQFTVLGNTYTRSKPWLKAASDGIPVVYDAAGRTIRLREAENRAFWAWAGLELLRHTGARMEEMLELSHHSITQYRLPDSDELIPLLHIAPSKTDEERLLVVSPELADVLATIVRRVRGQDGRIPLVPLYDRNERTWAEPAPLLFQWISGGQPRSVSAGMIRDAFIELLDHSGIKDSTGEPLYFQPHDLRRIFATEVIMNGMPPHIAQVLLGHKDINTTMGYKAVYPEEAIAGHRSFIARRRALRPSEEYRTPTDAEWDEFLGHFERRKLPLGDCGRAYGTSCQHEHACIRCPVLRVDPKQRHRLLEIRDNLVARIDEAVREHWLGEAEGLRVSLAAAEEKIAQTDRRDPSVDLYLPTFPRAEDRHAQFGQSLDRPS